MTNLLGNAIKFGAGRPIEVMVRDAGQVAELQVRDHGIGIDADRLPKIFDRFERAVSSTHYGGLGLGLYLAPFDRRIARRHDHRGEPGGRGLHLHGAAAPARRASRPYSSPLSRFVTSRSQRASVSVSVSVFEFVFEGGERGRVAWSRNVAVHFAWLRSEMSRPCSIGSAMLTRLAGLTQRRDSHALHPREPEHRQPRATLEHELEHAHAHASPLAQRCGESREEPLVERLREAFGGVHQRVDVQVGAEGRGAP